MSTMTMTMCSGAGSLSMHRDCMPGDDPVYVPKLGGTRMPRDWDPEDDTGYAL